jgi:hypothetical protein
MKGPYNDGVVLCHTFGNLNGLEGEAKAEQSGEM